jgi:RHS repeat-associated protein
VILPGQYFDEETGLHYNYFRDYDPLTGRYVHSDPIGLEGGLNPYLYAEGDPLRYSDPLGLQANTGVLPLPGASAAEVAASAARAAAAACKSNPILCAAGIGFGAGTLAYPLVEPLISPAVDAMCRDDADCDKEWEDAFRKCSRYASSPGAPRGVTGGYTNLYDCARGLVSERCGGNAVDYGRGRSSAAGRGRGR